MPAAASCRPGRAAELAVEALDAGGDTTAVLVGFVELVGSEVTSGSSGDASGGVSPGDDDGGGSAWVLPALLVGAAGVGGALLLRSSRRRKAERERSEAADRELLRAELSVLADDVVRLESGRPAAPRCAVRLRRCCQPLPGRPGCDRPRRRAGRSRCGSDGWSTRLATRWTEPGRSSKGAEPRRRRSTCGGWATTVSRR